MSDFCQQCAIQIMGFDTKDLAGFCAKDEIIEMICEGCGGCVMVDHDGKRIDFPLE